MLSNNCHAHSCNAAANPLKGSGPENFGVFQFFDVWNNKKSSSVLFNQKNLFVYIRICVFNCKQIFYIIEIPLSFCLVAIIWLFDIYVTEGSDFEWRIV